jgi:hypothetical protein
MVLANIPIPAARNLNGLLPTNSGQEANLQKSAAHPSPLALKPNLHHLVHARIGILNWKETSPP